VAERPSRLVAPGEALELLGPPARFVGRGGIKLDAALDRFELDVAGAVALDAGASTGGFTDCLLQRGARHVFAVDVGRGQLDAGLRVDRRVTVIEGRNIRELTVGELEWCDDDATTRATTGSCRGVSGPVDLVTADLSFISLVVVAPVLAGPVVRRGGDVVTLVKPQFEAGRIEVSRGRGVIREPAVWHTAIVTVASALRDAGAAIMGAMPSPVTGASGNVEFLLHAVAGVGPVTGGDPDELASDAVAEALSRVAPPDRPTPDRPPPAAVSNSTGGTGAPGGTGGAGGTGRTGGTGGVSHG
jgi:23S rRNA (cytidine1920-2'-O)/16S rRNA (cytidine1409-2'-O)-methyltransferase